jgi:predicted dehydrogenase
MEKTPAKVGIVGCGQISGKYLENSKHFQAFDVVAVADTRLDAAQARAAEYEISKALSVEELLRDPEVEIVVNLTPHRVHGPVGLKVLEAGKHIYNEKPLTVYREDGRKLLDLAASSGLRVGGAPDTFFGGAWQTARKLIDEGLIGDPVGAFANLHARPPSRAASQDPNAYVSFYMTDFLEYGGSWAFDRGPYYLHALINLLGPVKRVTGSARRTWEERERGGKMMKVNAPTHVAGILDFASGAVCHFLMTADVYSTGLPHVEVYGTEGSLRCIDPNNFGGTLYLRKPDSAELIPVESRFGYTGNSRGVGVADMAAAIRSGRPHRASGEMAFHVVDIVNAIHESSAEGRHVELQSTCERPAPLPPGLADWTIDE